VKIRNAFLLSLLLILFGIGGLFLTLPATQPAQAQTTQQFGSANIVDGSLVNADISASAAIAFSKLAALTSGQLLVGNGSNVPTAVAMSGDITISNAGVTAIGAGKVTSAMLEESVLRKTTTALTAQNILDMYGAPVQLIAAPAAGKAIVVESVVWDFAYNTTQFAGGGNVSVEYADGTDVCAVIETANVTSAVDSLVVRPGTGVAIDEAAAIQITNATAPFTTGNSTANVTIWYHVYTLP